MLRQRRTEWTPPTLLGFSHSLAWFTWIAIIGIGSFRTIRADLLVSLEQVGGPAVAIPGQQTLVEALLKVELTNGSTLETSGLQTVVAWTVQSGSALPADIYTVNQAGVPTIGATAFDAEQSGFVFAPITPLFTDMNANDLNPNFQRFLAIVNFDSPLESVSLTESIRSIAKLRFAVAPDIKNVAFGFSFDGNADEQYGFLLSDGTTYQPFSNAGGIIHVVPEPSLAIPAVLFLGLLVRSGWARKARPTRFLACGQWGGNGNP